MRLFFKKNERIPKNDEVRDCIWKGRRFQSIETNLYCRANSLKRTRFAISAAKKLGKAHERVRIKRLYREAFRLNKHLLSPGFDIVVKPKTYSDSYKYKDAEKVFLGLCGKAAILKSSKTIK